MHLNCVVFKLDTFTENGNMLADYLANMAFGTTGRYKIHNFSDLPSQAKRILNLDKQEVANLRIRTKKIKPYIMCGEEEAVFIS